jgi:anaerobic selenocysteine-containing dehydrogenase
MGVENPKVKPPKKSAAGVPAVIHALEYSLEQTSLARAAINLLSINQTKRTVRAVPGPSPSPASGTGTSYCENGAKHINDEAATRRITREFFREHSICELAAKTDMWLNEQGRLTEPMACPGSDYYEPISWDGALELFASKVVRARITRRSAVLHLRPAQQRSGVRAAAFRASIARTPAGMQQLVP